LDIGLSAFNLVDMKKISLLLAALAIVGFSELAMAQNVSWVKKIGGTSSDYGQVIKKDKMGNLIAAGNYSGTIDLDPGSGVFNVTSNGSQDVFIVKLDSIGNFIWGKSVGGPSIDAVSDLKVDSDGNVYICGFFRGNADFDPSTANFTLSISSSGISADGFILKLDSNGSFVYVKQIGGTSAVDDHVFSIDLDNQGNLYATGYFNGTCDLDPGPGQFNVTSIGGSDIFIIKLSDYSECYTYG
jgi:hypothetical protein